MISSYKYVALLFIPLWVLSSCGQKETQGELPTADQDMLFRLVDPAEAGIDFQNTLPEEHMRRNIYNFNYLYNGAGVAAGDIDGDGLADLYFAGNEVENRLYRNLGDFQFEDITEKAGVGGGPGWDTGVQMVDINADGWLDIYVCRGGWEEPEAQRKNLLFINQKDGSFREEGAAYGIDDKGFSLDAAFFDYDRDGDLDLYVTNRPKVFNLNADHIAATRFEPPFENRDRLYRNDGGRFTDVSIEAGITPNYGYGLSVTIADLDGNGYEDIYVANDFSESDYLYMNQGDGTFREAVKEQLPHVAFYAMGTDIADFNNDGYEDILNVEMLPEDYKRSKTSMAAMNVDEYNYMIEKGMHEQFMHNMLQMNHGNGHFGDVSQITGIKTTDWSWACFLEDLDNDGHRDAFVANGYKRDVYDQDAIKKAEQMIREYPQDENFPIRELIELFPKNEQLNYFFRNTGEFKFEKVSTRWVKDIVSLSNGAALADLNNDGTIDIVTNNIDQPVQIYRNEGRQGHHFVRVKLKGPEGNTSGLGARVECIARDGKQVFQMKTSRGYLSGCEAIAHFGLGTSTEVREIRVIWPDRKISSLKTPQVDRVHVLNYTEASGQAEAARKEQIFTDGTLRGFSKPFVHRENKYWDYSSQILLPHRYSQNGPALAVADVNGDGLEDLYVGGAIGQAGSLYLQGPAGRFQMLETAAFNSDKNYEDIAAAFFDADGDGDTDLYVGSGGFEFPEGDRNYQDRLYVNNGSGIFERAEEALPELTTSTGCVTVGDFDRDGRPDLFVGGRVVPDRYPSPAVSFILKNEGGRFTDVTGTMAPELKRAGMVTAAEWYDMDSDGDRDLVIAGEWMAVSIYKNTGDSLVRANEKFGLAERVGWWHSLLIDDLDGDGKPDIVAGNIGKNHKFKGTDEKPFHVYADDFDDNGSFDVVLAKYAGDVKVPVRGRQCSSDQMPFIKDKFSTFHDFADADLDDIYGDRNIESALHYEANEFSTVIWWGGEDGFVKQELPILCQISLVTGILSEDVNGDGLQDLVIAGNMYHTERETTRSDAGTGRVLLQKTDRSWNTLAWEDSGLFLPWDVKRVSSIELGSGGNFGILAACNNDTLRLVVKR